MQYLITFIVDSSRFPWSISISIKKRHICPHISAATMTAQDEKDRLGCLICKKENEEKKKKKIVK